MKVQTKYGDVVVLAQCPLLTSTERLEWLTEVHESFGGDEIRHPLRDAPRQVLKFEYAAFKKALGDMFHMVFAHMSDLWAIPLKQISLPVPDKDGDFILFDTANVATHLFVGGYALIETATEQHVVEITDIGRYVIIQEEIRNPDTDEIIQELETEYQDGFRISKSIDVINAKISPLRICVMTDDVDLSVRSKMVGYGIEFHVLAEDAPSYTAEIPAQYQGFDFYTMPLLLDGTSLGMRLHKQQTRVDGDVGGFKTYSHWKKPRYEKKLNSFIFSKQHYLDYYKFLYRRSGRYREFWQPLYEKHLNVLNTGFVGTVLNIDTKFIVEADRKHIAVKKVDGTWSAHEITQKTANYFTVSPAINLQRNQIKSICYLGLYRFDSDHIEFQFLGAGRARTSVQTVEIDN
jgi:hypothetical protein